VPGDRRGSANPVRSKAKQEVRAARPSRLAGVPPGRPLEASGNARCRWMAAAPTRLREGERGSYRTRLTGRLPLFPLGGAATRRTPSQETARSSPVRRGVGSKLRTGLVGALDSRATHSSRIRSGVITAAGVCIYETMARPTARNATLSSSTNQRSPGVVRRRAVERRRSSFPSPTG